MMDYVAATTSPAEGVDTERFPLSASDGATLDATWYRRSTGEQPGSAVLYIHGGGMIFGLEHIGAMCDLTCVGMSPRPGYRCWCRLPRRARAPTPDARRGLLHRARSGWPEQATTLGFDPARLAVMGDSAGGGLAAGVCLMARDRGGPAVAQQLLIYPMLDDRPSTPDPALLPFLTWTYDDNLTGWGALLGDKAGGDDVSPYAAPARAADLAGLPDTYIDVGDLDIFRDEDITYARRLSDAGVPTEFHLHPGCPHTFETLARGADVATRALNDRVRRLRSL